MRSTAVRAPRTAPDRSGAEITPEAIRAYLDTLSGRGRSRGTIQVYAARLEALYAGLPPDKRISPGTLAAWRETLLAQGYSPGTVNTHLSAANGLLDYLGRRDLQLVGQLEPEPAVRPELTRAEYLRLLQAARSLEKERTYLLVKVFALLGLPVGELPRLTVEQVQAGHVLVRGNGAQWYEAIPRCLEQELRAYIRRRGRAE